MARGQPVKKPWPTLNISGLHNQSRQSSPFSESTPQPTPPRSQAPSPDGDESDLEEDDEDLDFLIHFDTLKINLAHEKACPDEGEEEEEELEEWEGFGKEDLAEAMVGMFEVDDPSDLDWLPERLKNKRNKRKKEKKGMYSQSFSLISLLIMQPERPKTYQKGPDVMSKSERTQRRHTRAFQGQGQLSGFGFKAPSYPARVVGPKMKANLPALTENVKPRSIAQPPAQLPSPMSLNAPNILPSQMAGPSRMRSASVLSDPSTDGEAVVASGFADVDEMDAEPPKDDESLVDDMNDEELEDWEADLDESVQGPKSHIRDWSDLHKQIKDHLKKNSKTLPLSRLN